MDKHMSVYEKLKALDITLAAPVTPAAAYVMYAQTGNTVFISGHIAKRADGSVWVGQPVSYTHLTLPTKRIV